MPRKYTKKTDPVRTPLGVLTRANEAVAQGGNYTRVTKECSIERMKLKNFYSKEETPVPCDFCRLRIAVSFEKSIQ